MTTFWAPLLHIYQPPTQDIEVLRRIDAECYKPLFKVLDNLDRVKFSLNINGILIELLKEFGMGDSIDLLKNLVSEDKIEILGTGKFHPILPLFPRKEISRQIRLNEEINREEFGNNWIKKGFFPPEMAISTKVAKIVRNYGYKWLIMSGIACPTDWPYDRIYTTPDGLQLFFRDDLLSNRISFKDINAKEFVSELASLHKTKLQLYKNNTYIITAMDGETFGHHIRGYEKTFIAKTFKLINENNNDLTKENDKIEMEFISNLDHFFPTAKDKLIPCPSSWSTTSDDLKNKIPYPLWKHPDNSIHKYYWKIIKSLNKLINLADRLDIEKDWNIENYHNTARYFYDRGLHSCPIWWANATRNIWSPNLIYKGIELLIRAALNAQLALVNAGESNGDGYFDSISYYHGLLLMELYSISKQNLRKQKK
ncbi:MAG: hypothetical protein JXA99_06215 [Candidatus Lokiarchaeota archaeon]|nr:hypothetical protein [Candidatus Lokiarchaeota archaeon]